MRLVFLHGAAAAGKLTTARELERLVGYPVFHNHLIVDALTAVFPFGTEPFVRLREEFWLKVVRRGRGHRPVADVHVRAGVDGDRRLRGARAPGRRGGGRARVLRAAHRHG